jgi:hypothetical protein
MTYDEDPARWTSSPDEAPEILRGAFRAARNEGPSRHQMRSLALKLAAASAGGAVAVGTVKAASAGQTLATAASWSAGKIAAVVAIAGSLVTGGAVMWQAGSDPHANVERVGAAASSAPASAPLVQGAGAADERTSPQLEPGSPRVQPIEGTPIVETLAAAEDAPQTRPTSAPTERSGAAKRATGPGVAAKTASGTAARGMRAAGPKPTRARDAERAGQATREPEVLKRTNENPKAPQSEIELLRRAQVALTARPREAFQLTQEHRKLYPAGEFAQERDALAIQALMRTGDSEKARDLAAAFVRSYPSSPHAHRFREAMGLR